MASYVPHTDDEVEMMLADLGMTSIDDLFRHVPASLRLDRPLHIADGMSEADVADELARLAGRNLTSKSGLVCFAGSGAYDHDVSSVVRRVGLRAEFVTAYTPYQPEVSQGVLQALFEFQTMVTRLFGLPIANASLYDGATAMVEAINLCAAAASNQTVWLSNGVHATWRQVAHTMARGTGHQLRPVGLQNGVTSWPDDVDQGEKPGVLVVGYPNALGAIEDLRDARAVADRHGAMLVVCADPLSLALLESPGQLGADVVIGEGQGFGTPLSLGGPYVGLMAVSEPLLRRLPGRLVGETVDTQDRRAYVTTLRAREQDIRREKATSNVCTNQTLIAVAFLIQIAWLGTRGLRDLALVNASATRYLADQLRLLDGVDVVDAPFVREFAYQTRLPALQVLDALAERGILGGVVGDDAIDPTGRTIVVAVTERRTRTEIDAYVAAMAEIVGAR